MSLSLFFSSLLSLVCRDLCLGLTDKSWFMSLSSPVYRHLQDHEAPFVSLQTVNVQGSFRITIRMR